MTILALMFGFALACVIGVVYLLSKRQISVVQNNSTSVTTERTDSSTGGSGRVERFLIKWTFIAIVAGLVIATLANAISTASMSFPNASVGNPQSVIVATPAPMPTVAAPSLPLPLGEGRGEGVSTNPLTIIIPLLAGAVLTIWGYATINIIKIKRARRRASPAQREAQLESMLDQIETL
jgi:hypothetical protein